MPKPENCMSAPWVGAVASAVQSCCAFSASNWAFSRAVSAAPTSHEWFGTVSPLTGSTRVCGIADSITSLARSSASMPSSSLDSAALVRFSSSQAAVSPIPAR